MSLYKRKGSPCWYASFALDGRRVSFSTGTTDRCKAQEVHDRRKAELWDERRLGVKPAYTWADAVLRWSKEKADKASLADDLDKFRWLAGVGRDGKTRHAPLIAPERALASITHDEIAALAARKRRETSAISANRLLALVRAVLRRAWLKWQWLDRLPAVELYREPRRRVRFLSADEAAAVLAALPEHLADVAAFSLATGLRMTNATRLEWSQVDLARAVAWIHADQAKARRPIAVPLNAAALAVLERVRGRHARAVFVYQGRPLVRANTRSWREALVRAGVANFRWHDLRHTWASWHIQAGTPIAELQELGGWETVEMVRRYAHLGADNLSHAATRIEGRLAVASSGAAAAPVPARVPEKSTSALADVVSLAQVRRQRRRA